MGKRPARHYRKVKVGKGRKKTKLILVNPDVKKRKSRAALQISPLVQAVRREGVKAQYLDIVAQNQRKAQELGIRQAQARRQALIARRRALLNQQRMLYQVPQQRIMYNQPTQFNPRQAQINQDLQKSIARQKRAETFSKIGKGIQSGAKFLGKEAQIGAKFLGDKTQQAYGKYQINQISKAREKSEMLTKMENARQNTIDKYGLGG